MDGMAAWIRNTCFISGGRSSGRAISTSSSGPTSTRPITTSSRSAPSVMRFGSTLAITMPMNSIDSGVVIAPRVLQVSSTKRGRPMPASTRSTARRNAVSGGEKMRLRLSAENSGWGGRPSARAPSIAMPCTPSVQNVVVFAMYAMSTYGRLASPNRTMFTGNPMKIVFDCANCTRNTPRLPGATLNRRARTTATT